MGGECFFIQVHQSDANSQQFHQIFAGKEPFSDLPNFRTIERIVVEINLHAHQSLVKPSNMTPELWVILQRCLAVDPARRPTMNEVVAELQRLAPVYNH